MFRQMNWLIVVAVVLFAADVPLATDIMQTTNDDIISAPVTPPPAAAIDSLVAHGYLSPADRDFIWSMYYHPLTNDDQRLDNPLSLLGRLWKIFKEVAAGTTALEWAAEVCTWLDESGSVGGGPACPPAVPYYGPNEQ
jgi:hypothetical protein